MAVGTVEEWAALGAHVICNDGILEHPRGKQSDPRWQQRNRRAVLDHISKPSARIGFNITHPTGVAVIADKPCLEINFIIRPAVLCPFRFPMALKVLPGLPQRANT